MHVLVGGFFVLFGVYGIVRRKYLAARSLDSTPRFVRQRTPQALRSAEAQVAEAIWLIGGFIFAVTGFLIIVGGYVLA